MGKRFSVMRLCGLRREAAQPMIAKQQYHRLMKEYQSTENVTASAMKADISRPTARKYLEAQQPPDRLQVKHTWRTRPDHALPFRVVVVVAARPASEPATTGQSAGRVANR